MSWLKNLLAGSIVTSQVDKAKAKAFEEAAELFAREGDTTESRKELRKIYKKHGITQDEVERVAHRLWWL